MHPFVTLLHLAGAVMLLLWAVRMVRTGMERAYGPALKAALRGSRRGHRGHVGMAAAGTGLAVLLQSSTAVAILAAGFASSGLLTVRSGLAALLGADLGSALVVRILSLGLDWLIPILMLAGATMFLKFEARKVRQGGRIVLGIAFVLLALEMIGEATEPLRDSAALPAVVRLLENDPLTGFALAAALAWLMHSSVAAVLLFVAFAAGGALPFEAALPMVLGANLGGGIVAVWLSRDLEAAARRIPVGNLVFRATAAILGLVLLMVAAPPLDWLGAGDGTRLANFHVLFNLALVILALPLLPAVERLSGHLVRDTAVADATLDPARPASALDRSTLTAPHLAIASAKRELLRMGETVETMFRPVTELFETGNPQQIARIRALDEEVNQMHTDIKMFLAEVRRGELSDEMARTGIELTEFAINLEHIGDLISKTLMGLVEDKARKTLRFSEQGWGEICRLHARVHANMQLALNVLISGDLESARALAKEKEALRRLERETQTGHLERLQSGNAESIETSDLHLETVRAMKEINSLLVTVAYPILSESGLLLKSRLARPAQ